MKILHTSDWHLGKRLDRLSRHEEQAEVLDEICQIADRESVHAVIIAGDLFDGFNPPSESVDLLYKTMKRLADDGRRAVIAIAGNHDSPERIDAPDPLARECGIFFSGSPLTAIPAVVLGSGLKVTRSAPGFIEVELPGQEPLRVITTPYANEYRMKKALESGKKRNEHLRKVVAEHWAKLAGEFCDDNGVNVLTAHLFLMPASTGGGGAKGNPKDKSKLSPGLFGEPVVPEEPEGEKPILHVGGLGAFETGDLPKQLSYAALGHLHRRLVVSENPYPMIYSGSPLSYSFSEAGQEKFVEIVDVQPARPAVVTPVKLNSPRSLLRKRFYGVEEAVQWLKQNPEPLLEVTIVSDAYLNASDRKKINTAHGGVLTIIPEIKSAALDEKTKSTVDISLDIESLFRRYFYSKHEVEPDAEILQLFREVLGAGDDS